MSDETPTPPSPPTARPPGSRLARALSLSRIQAIVATLAGIVSVIGAGLSAVQFVRPSTGELVAVVSAGGSVTDATVEVLTPDNALVATLTPDAEGRVTQELKEGQYVVRVSHPRYAADVRRIQVQPQQTIELKATLRAGTSSPAKRTVTKGVSAVRRALGF